MCAAMVYVGLKSFRCVISAGLDQSYHHLFPRTVEAVEGFGPMVEVQLVFAVAGQILVKIVVHGIGKRGSMVGVAIQWVDVQMALPNTSGYSLMAYIDISPPILDPMTVVLGASGRVR